MKKQGWEKAFAAAGMVVFWLAFAGAVQAQTLNDLHYFSGPDGATPEAGLTIDAAGNLYGTTSAGGAGYGTVFKMSLKNGHWVINQLYSFAGGNDGDDPEARVVFGPDGALYGTTSEGGGADAGTVFVLRPPLSSCKSALCPWNETVIYRFTGGLDGGDPEYGDLTFDKDGNIYGTASEGGAYDYGVVYKLTRSGNNWTQSVLYNFANNPDGATPLSGVIFDKAGNLYGTTQYGGGRAGCGTFGCGVVFQLTPSDSGWTETIIHAFKADQTEGNFPVGGLYIDSSGNLYGTTCYGGTTFGGTVFEMSPAGGGSWTFTLLNNGLPLYDGFIVAGPLGNLNMDSAGNLYGTTYGGGIYDGGTVFKLTPSSGQWTYTSLHDFEDQQDGYYPYGTVVFDKAGNMYGTTEGAGGGVPGVVFQIVP